MLSSGLARRFCRDSTDGSGAAAYRDRWRLRIKMMQGLRIRSFHVAYHDLVISLLLLFTG